MNQTRFTHYRNRDKKHAIGSMKYDKQSGMLQVTFRITKTNPTLRVYAYAGVPHDVFEAFCKSDSKGVYFNTEIKDNYKGGCIRG